METRRSQLPLVMTVLRRRKRLTQSELASEVGTTQPDISLIESGFSIPKFEMLTKIASLLDASPDDLLLSYDDYVRKQPIAS